jgi:uncharacterized Zn finger protein
MRENADTKARRLLTEGRVIVLEAHGRHVEAFVHGDSGVYVVTHSNGWWSCDCPHHGRCSHVRAVQLVTAPVRPKGSP